MTQSRRIGAIFIPDLPPEALRASVLAAEAAGVGELWLWEDCFREGAFSSAGAALAWTERLRIGIGISPMPLRNVAIAAMEIATVERMFPGRLIPGVGHGVLSWMGQVGARVASPLTLMREYVPALRGLLAGETLTTDGRYVHLDDVTLDWPPAVAPTIHAAGEGPKTLRLTGEVADGTVLTGGTSPAQVAAARELIAEGRAAAGREGRNDIVVYVAVAFGADASARAAAQLERWNLAGEPERILTGDAGRIARGVEEYYEAGADAVILQPLPDESELSGFLGGVAEVAARVV
ncbi:LLM class flavin-dependent oxidoreductase [Microbacterium sulfonylureivorans]|uniref:LLM class flavin-dependent oxidoreductase n=1 Tax=Microbacterium sulfonylureivorans TaxID=2486854 RepID=UPI000FD890FE|nr:LLM class flavin-dependent oxidoreductase [Microbacterium sulfonylureivorans]